MDDLYFKARYGSEIKSLQVEFDIVEKLSAAVAQEQQASLKAAYDAAAAGASDSEKVEVCVGPHNQRRRQPDFKAISDCLCVSNSLLAN
jgi:hypothetical protein